MLRVCPIFALRKFCAVTTLLNAFKPGLHEPQLQVEWNVEY